MMPRRTFSDRTATRPGVTAGFFCGVVELLTDKYGIRNLDAEFIRERLEQIEHAYIRSPFYDNKDNPTPAA